MLHTCVYSHVYTTHVYLMLLTWTSVQNWLLETGQPTQELYCSPFNSLRLPEALHLELESCGIFLCPHWHINRGCHYASLVQATTIESFRCVFSFTSRVHYPITSVLVPWLCSLFHGFPWALGVRLHCSCIQWSWISYYLYLNQFWGL